MLVPAERAEGPAVPVLRVKCQCWGEKCPELALLRGNSKTTVDLFLKLSKEKPFPFSRKVLQLYPQNTF